MSKKFKDFWKNENVEKPGESIHSQKWDDCVSEVGKDPNVNAYAVCTAKLGEESFKADMTKSQMEKAIDILKAVCMTCEGTGWADGVKCHECGGSGMKKDMGISNAGPVPHSLLARQDLESSTRKGAVEQTGKELDIIEERAKEATDTEEKYDLVNSIKSVQEKRQKAVINARKSGSFKDNWNKINER